jgi:hypothetical protein
MSRVQLESVQAVEEGAARLRDGGPAAFDERDTTCCFALQDRSGSTTPPESRGRSTPSRTTTPTPRRPRSPHCPR